MKRSLGIVALAFATIGMTACNPGGGDSNVLKVGMECAYAPFNWMQDDDSNGAVKVANVQNKFANGYDVQIAKKIAEALGKTLEVYQYEWDGLIPAVKSGALDCICAGMSPTAERKQTIEFSSNYYQSNLVIVTKKGSSIDGKTSLAEVDVAGVKIAAQPGTFHATALENQTHNCEKVTNLADFTVMRTALNSNTITGYIAEEPTAMALTKGASSSYSFVPLKNNTTGFTTDEGDTAIAVGLKQGSNLTNSINDCLGKLSASDWSTLMQQMVDLQPEE